MVMEIGYSSRSCSLIVMMVLVMSGIRAKGQGTRVGFWRTCPRAESIVRSIVATHVRRKPAIAASLLRMHSHDCFVQGCDGSVLTDGPNTEKTAIPNRSLNGYNVIDEAKAQLEAACPSTVSCADILALAARDAAVLFCGRSWQIPTGRRDIGRISLASETNQMPDLTHSTDDQIRMFSAKGLNTQDVVELGGGLQKIGIFAVEEVDRRSRKLIQTPQRVSPRGPHN